MSSLNPNAFTGAEEDNVSVISPPLFGRKAAHNGSFADDDTARDPLLEAFLVICGLYERHISAAQLTAGLPLDAGGHITVGLLERVGARADLSVSVRHIKHIKSVPAGLLPAMLELKDRSVVVLMAVGKDSCTILRPQLPSKPIDLSLEDIGAQLTGTVIFCAPVARNDDRIGLFGTQKGKHWFWSEVSKYKLQFAEIAGAAALTNVLAICTSLFSRQVFDRVVPNQAFATLWVLVIGVLIAIALEFTIRMTRAYLVDIVGKRLDLGLSSRVFEQALGLRLDQRPKSTGSFVNQVRECDSVREFFTSTTIAAVSDLPFVFLFIAIIWVLGGPMAWVQIAAIPLIVIPGVLAQPALSKVSNRHLRENSIRNGLLIEAMTGAETVKVLRAEGRFQRLWEEYAALLAVNSTKMRALTNSLSYMASSVQQIAYVMLMVVGVYLISVGELTTGSLLACSILSSRAISPLTQLAGIFGRYQQMRAGLTGLEGIIKAQVDRPSGRHFVQRTRLNGDFRIEELEFRYEQGGDASLKLANLEFQAGSAVALLGTNGSGKSTLLKILSGLYQPSAGSVLLDGTDMRQIDPDDVRRQVTYLPQDVRLFFGTLRENLLMGLKPRPDQELLEALTFVGAESLVRDHPKGLDREIGEGGSGISGGQRQSVGLARVWLRDPSVVLLDEPTAAMDHALEMKVIANMRNWLAGRTFIVATHRQPVLQLVNDAIIMNKGKITASGPLDSVLAGLAGPSPKPSRNEGKTA